MTLRVLDEWDSVLLEHAPKIMTEVDKCAELFHTRCCWMGYEALSTGNPQDTLKKCLGMIPIELVENIVVTFVGPFGGHTGVCAHGLGIV
jgi:hypothetical protein